MLSGLDLVSGQIGLQLPAKLCLVQHWEPQQDWFAYHEKKLSATELCACYFSWRVVLNLKSSQGRNLDEHHVSNGNTADYEVRVETVYSLIWAIWGKRTRQDKLVGAEPCAETAAVGRTWFGFLRHKKFRNWFSPSVYIGCWVANVFNNCVRFLLLLKSSISMFEFILFLLRCQLFQRSEVILTVAVFVT